MQNLSPITSLYFAGKDQQIKYEAVVTAPANIPVRVNIHIVFAGGTEVKRSLPPYIVGTSYRAMFDINQALYAELFSLSASRVFAFPGDPDSPMLERKDLMMLNFWVDVSYDYKDVDGNVQEGTRTNNSNYTYWAIQGGINRWFSFYLQSQGLSFLQWLNADAEKLKFLSWIPNDMPVHPDQPLRLWFYNDSLISNPKVTTEVTFTDGTTQQQETIAINGTSGLYEVACGPNELRISTFDITKQPMSYKVWLAGKSIGNVHSSVVYTLTAQTPLQGYTFMYLFNVAWPKAVRNIAFSCEMRIANNPAGNNHVANMRLSYNDTSNNAIMDVLDTNWETVSLSLNNTNYASKGLKMALTFASGDIKNTGTTIEIRNVSLTDSDTGQNIAATISEYYPNFFALTQNPTTPVLGDPIKTEAKSFVIDRTHYERNDILFFRTSLGVNEVLWCHGRRSEKLKTSIDERTHPLAADAYSNGTIRAYRGKMLMSFNMNTGWFPKNMRHYLADFVAAAEAKLLFNFWKKPVIIEGSTYDWGEDGEDLFSLAFKIFVAHEEIYFSPTPDPDSPWGAFNDDFNQDFN